MKSSTLIMGGMYSGKSKELDRLIKRNEFAGKKCVVFKLKIDDRYSNDKILNHDDAKYLKSMPNTEIKKLISKLLGIKAISISKSSEILDYIRNENIDVVGIDEVQFFDNDIINIIEQLNSMDIEVIMSGLDMYSNGNIFPITAQLACKCKYVDKLHAVCVDCGNDAMYSFRLNDNNSNAIIDIGSEGKYIALCENCRSLRL